MWRFQLSLHELNCGRRTDFIARLPRITSNTYQLQRIIRLALIIYSTSWSGSVVLIASHPSKSVHLMTYPITVLSNGPSTGTRCRRLVSRALTVSVISNRSIWHVSRRILQIQDCSPLQLKTASEFAEQIDTVATEILDAHCPTQTRT